MTVLSIKRRRMIAASALALGSVASGISRAQAGTITLIVPFPPGATADPLARNVAERIRKRMNKQAIVVNRPGASAIIGTEALARSAPDGQTIGMIAGPFVLNAVLRDKLPYDTVKDFVPITRYVRMPLALSVNPSLPVKSVKELVAYARANPDKVSLAIPAPGTFGDIAARRFTKLNGIDIPLIPYKGGGPAVMDLIGGQVSALFETFGSVSHQHRAGKLRIIAVAAPTRLAAMPDVETMAEAGYPNFEYSAFFGWAAPAGTPPSVATAFAEAINDLSPSEKADMVAQGFELVLDTPSQFADSLRAEIERWRKEVKELGIARLD